MVRDVYRICEVLQAQKALNFGNYGRSILIATTKSRINLDHETTIVFNGCFTWKSSKSLPEKCMFRVLGSDPETGFSRGQTQSVQVQADNPHTTRQSFAWFFVHQKNRCDMTKTPCCSASASFPQTAAVRLAACPIRNFEICIALAPPRSTLLQNLLAL